MPRPKSSEEAAAPEIQEEEVLRPFTVIMNGADRTIFATDEEDLQRRLENLRGESK